MRVLGISGSLRSGSLNTRLLRAAAEVLPPEAELVIWDGLKDVPPYSEEDDTPDAPLAVRRLRDAIAEADAVLFATPEYNGSIPGQLKNAIDWASRPRAAAALMNKPVAVVGATPGMFGAVWAQADLRRVLSTAGARVVDEELPVPQADTIFDDEGRLTSDEIRNGLADMATELVSAARPVGRVAA